MSENYFALLGLEVNFFIDLKTMEKNYVAMQSSMHPDCFSDPAKKESAVVRIAEVNEAYSVLKSPLARAEYILELNGTKLQNEDRNSLVSEVFDMCDSQDAESAITSEILKCQELMGKFFEIGDMYQAALQVEKLKYLKKLNKSGAACSC
ncbi:Fe-S protein assembly co-chaperone HscB [Anaplasma marginale]|uniref:Fe-S protein assembly co-chaperone HscB n=1 Tax=Anaplasma marginale TaxID=770 RepID=UPI000E596FE3|nr:Fe-S protein assembly co-chaperone HscB [Anaplasma marginale]AXW84550.1 Fe-S protein assembly co-chaperone HscB [Anaplasma marginale]